MNGLIKFLLFLSISIAAIPVEASWFARGAGLLKNRLMQSTLALAGGYTAALLAHQAFESQQHANTQNTIHHITLPEHEKCCQEIVKVQREREEAIKKLAADIYYHSNWLTRFSYWLSEGLINVNFCEKSLKRAQELYADFDEVKGAVFGSNAPKIELVYDPGVQFAQAVKNNVHIGSGFIYGQYSEYFKGVLAHEFGHIINGDCEKWWKACVKDHNVWMTLHKREYLADKIAAEAGYGNELKEFLKKKLRYEWNGGPDKAHPRCSERIALIDYYLKTGQEQN